MLDRNKERIIKFYKLNGDNLELVEVVAKIVPNSGTYYKFTVMDKDNKSVVAKIDDLHTRSRWNSSEWAQR